MQSSQLTLNVALIKINENIIEIIVSITSFTQFKVCNREKQLDDSIKRILVLLLEMNNNKHMLNQVVPELTDLIDILQDLNFNKISSMKRALSLADQLQKAKDKLMLVLYT